jgi:hypothetical protein
MTAPEYANTRIGAARRWDSDFRRTFSNAVKWGTTHDRNPS